MVPWPTIVSPAISTAVWPGEAPTNSSPSSTSSASWRPVAGGADGGRQGARVVAQADRVDAGAVAVEDGVADPHAAGLELGPGPDRDRVGAGVGGDHVERLGGGDADAAALADGEVVVAAVAADRAAGAVEHGAVAVGEAAVAAQEAALALTGEEAEVLALRPCARPRGRGGRRSPAPRAWSARSAGRRAGRAAPAAAPPACSSGPWPRRRRWPAAARRVLDDARVVAGDAGDRRRAARRGRPSPRSAPRRCRAHRGWACVPAA